MKKIIGISLVILAVFTFLFFPQGAQAKKLYPAPEFKLSDLNGNLVNLSDYRDKQTVILFFWTTWCHFCRKELKILKDKYAELEKSGVELLAINVQEPAEKIKNYIKNYALTFKVLLDKDALVGDAYNIFGVPTYVLIDKAGNVHFADHYFPEKEYQGLK